MPPPAEKLHSISEYRAGVETQHRLLGFRSSCGFRTVTWCLACPRCGKRDLEETEFTGRGRIAAFTVQTVPGEEFVNEAPYAYVLVDLAEGGRAAGWMPSIRSVTELAIGGPVHWVPSYKSGLVFEKDTARAEAQNPS